MLVILERFFSRIFLLNIFLTFDMHTYTNLLLTGHFSAWLSESAWFKYDYTMSNNSLNEWNVNN